MFVPVRARMIAVGCSSLGASGRFSWSVVSGAKLRNSLFKFRGFSIVQTFCSQLNACLIATSQIPGLCQITFDEAHATTDRAASQNSRLMSDLF